jgi:hypothetical protein
MRRGGRWAAGCLAGLLVGALALVALAGSSGGATGSGNDGLSAGLVQSASLNLRSASLGSPVGSGAQSSDEGQPAAAAQQARRNSPAAFAARTTSLTKFEHLGAARAAQVAREAFPEAIERPAGGPPQLPAGGRLLRYVSDNAAQVALPGGKRAVVESTAPMAIETSPGHRAPVDLGLTSCSRRHGDLRRVKMGDDLGVVRRTLLSLWCL